MIILDYQDRRPIYEQIVEKFQALILSGALPPESRLPSVRKLALDLSINPNTIQRAYAQLEQMGLVYPVKGRGNFVSPDLETASRKRELYYQELRECVRKGKACGVSEEELLEHVKDYYREEAI